MVPSSSRFLGFLLLPGEDNHPTALFSFSGFYHSIREFTILIVEWIETERKVGAEPKI
jgi:hypothetical protein